METMTTASFLNSLFPAWSSSYRNKRSRFKYSRLLSLELRLLELQPGSPKDPLSGIIHQKELAPGGGKIPEFEALSYCWGDQSNPEPINLTTDHHSQAGHSNKPFRSGCINIGPNLASALRSLRYRDRSRMLWCDSICINQEDLAERSIQVQRMYDVYRWAKAVVIWLGTTTSWSNTIMETLQELEKQLPQIGYLDALYNTDQREEGMQSSSVTRMTLAVPFAVTEDQLFAFEQLLALDWHRRVWTHQEIALANQETSIVRLGNEQMPWSRFKNAVLFICMHIKPPLLQCFLDPVAYEKNVVAFSSKAIFSSMDTRNSIEWVSLLSGTSLYECTDDRDRLYALRGFLTTDVASSIPVDYKRSPKQILASACVAHIARNRDLQFLELCNSDTLPTWTADLGKRFALMLLHGNAGGRSVPSAVLIKSGVLEVAGVSCDEICSNPIVLPYRHHSQPEDDYMTSVIQVLRCLTENEDFYEDEKCLDELIAMMRFGLLWDYLTAKIKSPPDSALISLENGRDFIRHFITHNTIKAGLVDQLVDNTRVGATACTRTRNGSFARVPAESRAGDIIVTLLGLRCNLVLRPQRKKGHYKVVGPSYHPGLSHGQALLGDDFDGWERLWSTATQSVVFWKEGYPLRPSDPRLVGIRLPKGYIRHRFTIDNGEEAHIWQRQDEKCTEMEARCDPRMSEEELRKRGVPIQKFRLI